MKFSEKLDFLMDITKTKNSALALYTSLDASHISRLRRGQRNLSKNENYVKAMATYFSKRCIEEYQRKALSNLLNNDSLLSDDHEKTVQILYHWLLDDKASSKQEIGEFLSELSNFQFKKTSRPKTRIYSAADIYRSSDSGIKFYYGVNGQRQSVIEFLSMILNLGLPRILYLFSDEDMGWLADDPKFTAKWASLMSQVIMRGSKIKIIHTVSRDLHEMLAAIRNWMPLYMTGAIEPYYYPKKRDGVFRRTLFIVPETAAVVSSSVGNMTDNSVSIFITEKKAIASFSTEYNNYLSLCRPLMRIFTPQLSRGYYTSLLDFEGEKTNTLINTESLSVLTMPEDVAEKVIMRTGSRKTHNLRDFYKARKQSFENLLRNTKFCEIVRIPDIGQIKNGKVPVAFSDMLLDNATFYTPNEYKLHLLNIIALLQSDDNYSIYFDSDAREQGYMLYVKEGTGVIVAKTSPPPVILVINESNMTAAYADYLHDKISGDEYDKTDKQKAILKLQGIIDKL